MSSKPSIADVVDPFGLCHDPDKKAKEEREYQDNLNFLVAEITEWNRKINRLSDEANRMRDERDKLETHLKLMCRHEKTIEEKDYFGGSYLDQAYTKRRNICIVCDAKSEWTTQMHSSYG